MKSLGRLFFFYAIPILIAFFLFTLTWRMSVELSEIAGEALQGTSNASDVGITDFFKTSENPRYDELQRMLYWSQIAYIILTMILGGLLSSRTLGYRQATNVVTAIALGILTSKIMMGYPFLSWVELFTWISVGVACYLLVFTIRSG